MGVIALPYPSKVAASRAGKVNAALAVIAAAVAGGCAMDTEPKNVAAGGFPIAVGAIGGAALGSAAGQATAGFLAGVAAGVAVAVLIWLRGR